jgi:hypothetical protein
MPKEKKCPIGENSPNLVTLVEPLWLSERVMRNKRSLVCSPASIYVHIFNDPIEKIIFTPK